LPALPCDRPHMIRPSLQSSPHRSLKSGEVIANEVLHAEGRRADLVGHEAHGESREVRRLTPSRKSEDPGALGPGLQSRTTYREGMWCSHSVALAFAWVKQCAAGAVYLSGLAHPPSAAPKWSAGRLLHSTGSLGCGRRGFQSQKLYVTTSSSSPRRSMPSSS
jgi:hypothetical protein